MVATVDAHTRDQLLEQCLAGRVLPVREGIGDMGADLVEVDACVYETALNFPGASAADIAALAGLSDKTTRRATTRLTNFGWSPWARGQVHPDSPIESPWLA